MNIKNILLVDDSCTSRMIIKQCFKTAGYHNTTFYEAADGLEAITIINENQIDLVVTDLNMPRVNGENLIKMLKFNQTTSHLKILVITSIEHNLLRNELDSLGIYGFIKKPISTEKLIKVIGECNG